MLDPQMYALGCARANPGKANAVMCLRNIVEAGGWPYKVAVAAIAAAFPLGLSEFGDIATEAQKRYAPKAGA